MDQDDRFPSAAYAIALVILIAAVAAAGFTKVGMRVALVSLASAALIFDLARIGPYFTGAPEADKTCAPDRTLSIMVANVKLENRHADALLQIASDRRPDLLLALETNEWWDRQLAALSARMPYAVAEITSSYSWNAPVLTLAARRDTDRLSRRAGHSGDPRDGDPSIG